MAPPRTVSAELEVSQKTVSNVIEAVSKKRSLAKTTKAANSTAIAVGPRHPGLASQVPGGADLSPAETAAHHAERKQFYLRMYPETKPGARPGRSVRGLLPGSLSDLARRARTSRIYAAKIRFRSRAPPELR